MPDIAEGRVDPRVVREFFNKDLPQNQLRQNYLAYAWARRLKGPGRLNIDDVRSARADVSLTGLRSARGVRDKLSLLRDKLLDKQQDAMARMAGEVERNPQPIPNMPVFKLNPEGTGLVEVPSGG